VPKESMEFTQREVKTINLAIKFVNNWYWIKWGILISSIIMFSISYYLISSTNDTLSDHLLIVSILLSTYLARNWARPTKDSLLLKLVRASSAHNKPFKQDK
jgi:hypothetical protein